MYLWLVCKFVLACAYLVLCGVRGVQDYVKEFGKHDYVEYHTGTLNVILGVPHGGSKRPAHIPDRDAGCWDAVKSRCIWFHNCGTKSPAKCKATTVTDDFTLTLATLLAVELRRITQKRPHVVINNLHRTKLDANRAQDEATFGVPEAKTAWREFHSFINRSKAAIGGMGLFLDIHGQSHKEDWIELGYLVSASDLNRQNLDSSVSSIKNLAQYVNISFKDLLSGYQSLGGYLQDENYTAVPSPLHPGPKGGKYYHGGFNTHMHGSRYGGQVDAIQVESPITLRNLHKGPGYAAAFARSIRDFLQAHYPGTYTERPPYKLSPEIVPTTNRADCLIPRLWTYGFLFSATCYFYFL